MVPWHIRTIFQNIVRREGGFVDDPDDNGGATNMGITQRTLSQWCKREVTKDEVKRLPKEMAMHIYYELYWKPSKVELIEDAWVQEFLFDWIVNAGFRSPIRRIQSLAHVKSDGIIGPKTANAIDSMIRLESNVYNRMCDARVEFYIDICKARPANIKFLQGWVNRVNEFRYAH